MPIKNNKSYRENMQWICAYCHKKQNTPIQFSNNGLPLIDGRVCGSCNIQVILYRLRFRG